VLSQYIFKLYLKYIIILLVALEGFYVGLDFLGNSARLPDSANLKLLYILYESGAALNVTLPLGLVFAMIATKIHLIRANELVIVYALGMSRSATLKPFVQLSLLFSLFSIFLNSTSFAYFDQYARSIPKDKYFSSVTRDIFLKVDDSYLYIEKLLPIQKSALGVRLFVLKDSALRRVIRSESAQFMDNSWELYDGEIIEIPIVKGLQNEGLNYHTFESLKVLKGFQPKLLENVYEGGNYFSIIDAIKTILLLKSQEVNLDKVIASLGKNVLMPLFAPLLVVIIFFFVPISSRFLNITLFSSLAIFATLFVWGAIFALITLAHNGTINIYIGLSTPFILLFALAYWLYQKHSN
jgi:lipopolysaccharide export system permease protein